MRPIRILLVAIALVAVALTGWAIGARGDGYPGPEAGPTATTAAPQGEPAAAPAPADPDLQVPADPGGTPTDPGGSPGTTQPAPKPRIFGFGSEPVYPQEGNFWQLPPGGGEAILITDAEHASKVEFLLTPTGTGTAGLAVSLGVDTSRPYTAHWKWKDQPLLAHLTVRATGPGGTTEKVVGVYHADPAEQR